MNEQYIPKNNGAHENDSIQNMVTHQVQLLIGIIQITFDEGACMKMYLKKVPEMSFDYK